MSDYNDKEAYQDFLIYGTTDEHLIEYYKQQEKKYMEKDKYLGDYNNKWRKRFLVVIEFADGNRVEAKVAARNRNQAVYLVKEQQVYKDFAGNSDVVTETIEEIQVEPILNSRFTVTKVDNKAAYYAVTDSKSGIMVEFARHHYNDIQRVFYAASDGKPLTALQAATALREIGEFMFLNFYEIACKPKKQRHRYIRDSFGDNDNFSDFDANDSFNDDNNNA